MTVPRALISFATILSFSLPAAVSEPLTIEPVPLIRAFEFEANHGQYRAPVRFLARNSRYRMFLMEESLLFDTGRGSTVQMQFHDSLKPRSVVGENRLPGVSNYFRGTDPSEWHHNVPHFGRVRYRELYPGIDAVFYGNSGHLEYDFIVQPGARPEQIELEFTGEDRLELDADGNLLLHTSEGLFTLHVPRVWQEVDGQRSQIDCSYTISDDRLVRFQVDPYRRDLALVIDPILSYSTYLGGSVADESIGTIDDPAGIAADAAGAAYIVGTTRTTDFPTEAGYSEELAGYDDLYIVKLATDGSLVYSTYLGGMYDDEAYGIAVDSNGAAYVIGNTQSPDFPTDYILGQPAGYFVVKLSPAGDQLVYATMPGLHKPSDIAVDTAGAVYLTGSVRQLLGTDDVYVAKLAPAGDSVAYYKEIGGFHTEVARGIAVNTSGQAHITGCTSSLDFPTYLPLQSERAGENYRDDVFIAKLSADGTTWIFSTYLGGAQDDCGNSIAVDPAGNVYVTGDTRSPDFPVAAPYDGDYSGENYEDVFVSKLSADGQTLLYSTYLGGSSPDFGVTIAVDAGGAIYIGGMTKSGDFPMVAAPFPAAPDSYTGPFVAKLAADGSELLFSSFYGGTRPEDLVDMAIDPAGNIYITGSTDSTDLPTVNAIDDELGGESDAYVAKFEISSLAETIPVQIVSEPPGLPVGADGAGVHPGETLQWAPGVEHELMAVTPKAVEPYVYTFSHWSDDGAATHTVTTPEIPTTYTAYYSRATCDYDVWPTRFELGDGQSVSQRVQVNVECLPCVWTATSHAEWIHGGRTQPYYCSGLQSFWLDANTGPPREGTMTIAGQTVTIRQAGVSPPDGPGLYVPDSGYWFLRDTATAGSADHAYPYGPGGAGWIPLSGDWDGDGTSTPGLYVPSSGTWFLRNSHGAGPADVTFSFGPGGLGWIPLVGDWNKDGVDTPGLYAPATGTWFLRNSHSAGPADLTFSFGPGGLGWIPLAGDWDADGRDTPGLYDPASGMWFVRNSNESGIAQSMFSYGPGGLGWIPVVGDWNNDGYDAASLYDPASGTWFVRFSNGSGPASVIFSYGPGGLGWVPVVGVW